MSERPIQYPLKLISNFVSIITFIADLITVALFLRSVFLGDISLTSSVSQVLIIIVVFVFAASLWFYSKDDVPNPEVLFSVFGWLYIVFAATFFVIISQRFMMKGDYTLGEFVGYISLTFFIGGLGFFIYDSSNKRVDYFSIPFMLVALIQIIVWVFIIFSNNELLFNWVTAGNISLFVIAALVVLFFINQEKGSAPLLVLLALLAETGYILLGLEISSLWKFQVLWNVPPIITTIFVVSVMWSGTIWNERLEIGKLRFKSSFNPVVASIKRNYKRMRRWKWVQYERIADLAINELSIPECHELFRGLADGAVSVPSKIKYEYGQEFIKEATRSIHTVYTGSAESWQMVDDGNLFIKAIKNAKGRRVEVCSIFAVNKEDITANQQEFLQQLQGVGVLFVHPEQHPDIQDFILIDNRIAILNEKSHEGLKQKKLVINPFEVQKVEANFKILFGKSGNFDS